MNEIQFIRTITTRVELLEEVVAQARESCSCTRCDFCIALAELDKFDEKYKETK
jgi:hypothetical protein